MTVTDPIVSFVRDALALDEGEDGRHAGRAAYVTLKSGPNARRRRASPDGPRIDFDQASATEAKLVKRIRAELSKEEGPKVWLFAYYAGEERPFARSHMIHVEHDDEEDETPITGADSALAAAVAAVVAALRTTTENNAQLVQDIRVLTAEKIKLSESQLTMLHEWTKARTEMELAERYASDKGVVDVLETIAPSLVSLASAYIQRTPAPADARPEDSAPRPPEEGAEPTPGERISRGLDQVDAAFGDIAAAYSADPSALTPELAERIRTLFAQVQQVAAFFGGAA